MSGGSHNYIYCRIEEDLCEQMADKEMNDLIADIANVAHDLEWWHSADSSEENYRKTVRKFKAKWFGGRDARLIEYVNESCDKLKAELIEMIGGNK